MKTLKDLAGEKWRYRIDELDEHAELVRVDKTNPRARIGPLASVALGVTEEDEDGNVVFCLDGEDGRNLVLVAALPQFAGLIVWAEEQLRTLNGIHFDSATEGGRFHNELARRLKWLRGLVDERDAHADEGEYVLADLPPART